MSYDTRHMASSKLRRKLLSIHDDSAAFCRNLLAHGTSYRSLGEHKNDYLAIHFEHFFLCLENVSASDNGFSFNNLM